jgi:acyl-CoA reductase-like NAD-dependent aldehyde dehydrogenase
MTPVNQPEIVKLNPCTGEPLATYAMASEEDITQAVQQARVAQIEWKKVSLKTRARLLERVLQLCFQRSHTLAEMVSLETGKPLADALESDVAITLSALRYYADIGPVKLRPRLLANDTISLIAGRRHWETYHPRGVIGVISPWNYPLAIPASGIITALMAGNAVILKPSEQAPATSQLLVNLFKESLQDMGFSPHLVSLLQGNRTTGAALLAQDLDGVIFTGSAAVGRKVRLALAERGIWSSMELGGSDAMLILPGCDLEKAASYAIWGRFTNTGQACAGTKRLLVPEKDKLTLLQHLQDKISHLKVGPPDRPEHHIGPMISEQQLGLLDAQVRDAVSLGAKLWTGGHRLPGAGWFYAPTLLSDVPKQARILREEVFGPGLPVMTYQDVDEAIEQINCSEYGLTTSIFGPVDMARSIAPQLECGTVMINDVGPSNYAMVCAPWGGWKSSGNGVSHGECALLELSKSQVVSENRLYEWPIFGKPMWHFGRNSHLLLPERSKTVLAFSARHPSLWNPMRWLPFWQNRTNTRL